MKTEYVGIDYGMGDSNRDKKSGIHYGVISANECIQAWYDSAEPDYSFVGCPYCGNELKKKFDALRCPHCYKKIDSNRGDFDSAEPDSYILDDGEYKATQGGDGDIFIILSPYYTLCQYCSPCAPGAGYIMNECKEGIKAYCFGSDFFDDGKAPYTVYSVETGKEVSNEKQN
jgi:hypothetical protein